MNIKIERLEITKFTLDKIKRFKGNPLEKRLYGTERINSNLLC